MLAKQLVHAIHDEQKVLDKEKDLNIEKSFVIDNWQFFADNKGTVKGALFNSPKSGTEMLQILGIQNVVIKKIKQDVLVKSVIRMEKSPVFESFLKDVQLYKEVTTFFVVGKKALVMSNNQILKVPGKFIHRFESQGALNDIYWMWSDDLLGKVRFY